MRTRLALTLVLSPSLVATADQSKPLSPVEARKQVGEEVTVKMAVKASKDRLERHGVIYLDAEEDFRDKKNFAVVITKKGAASLKAAGISDPATHFKGKTITATGTVKEVEGVPRVEIDDAKNIAVVKE
jgi:DNA/RNA endonuclease YhcR with UshA esterase domain